MDTTKGYTYKYVNIIKSTSSKEKKNNTEDLNKETKFIQIFDQPLLKTVTLVERANLVSL